MALANCAIHHAHQKLDDSHFSKYLLQLGSLVFDLFPPGVLVKIQKGGGGRKENRERERREGYDK